MKETRAYTKDQVISDDRIRAFMSAIQDIDTAERTDIYAQMEAIRAEDEQWFNTLVNTFGPLLTSEFLTPGEKP